VSMGDANVLRSIGVDNAWHNSPGEGGGAITRISRATICLAGPSRRVWSGWLRRKTGAVRQIHPPRFNPSVDHLDRRLPAGGRQSSHSAARHDSASLLLGA
jgi:hypothetical protein